MGVKQKKFCEIRSTMNKVISAHVDLPYVDNALSAYTNAHVTLMPRKGESKIGLKCNKGALITPELGNVAPRKFGT